MTDTIKGALIGAIIPTVGSLAIFFLGNFHTQEAIETQFVEILSESFEYVDKSMSFEQSIESIKEYIQELEENRNPKNETDKTFKTGSVKISIFHLEELVAEKVGLYPDSHLTDNLGNVYKEGMGFYTNGFVEYTNLETYTNLTGTLVVSQDGKNNNFEGIFSIYDLDTMEKICDDIIITNDMEPYSLNCDISNVNKIKISFNITNDYDKYMVFFVEPKLERPQNIP